MLNDITIDIEAPDSPEVRELLRASDAYMAALYPAESNHLLNIDSLKQDNVTFVVARQGECALGCGCVVKHADGYAELKRMFVAQGGRGKGVGKRLLETLLVNARENGCDVVRLETGVAQAEAIALYKAFGFCDIEPFGDYKPDPLSLFMEKRG